MDDEQAGDVRLPDEAPRPDTAEDAEIRRDCEGRLDPWPPPIREDDRVVVQENHHVRALGHARRPRVLDPRGMIPRPLAGGGQTQALLVSEFYPPAHLGARGDDADRQPWRKPRERRPAHGEHVRARRDDDGDGGHSTPASGNDRSFSRSAARLTAALLVQWAAEQVSQSPCLCLAEQENEQVPPAPINASVHSMQTCGCRYFSGCSNSGKSAVRSAIITRTWSMSPMIHSPHWCGRLTSRRSMPVLHPI